MELTVKSHRGSPINDFTKSVATLQQMALQVFFESLGCLSTLFPCKKSTVVTKKEMFIESCESFLTTLFRPFHGQNFHLFNQLDNLFMA